MVGVRVSLGPHNEGFPHPHDGFHHGLKNAVCDGVRGLPSDNVTWCRERRLSQRASDDEGCPHIDVLARLHAHNAWIHCNMHLKSFQQLSQQLSSISAHNEVHAPCAALVADLPTGSRVNCIFTMKFPSRMRTIQQHASCMH